MAETESGVSDRGSVLQHIFSTQFIYFLFFTWLAWQQLCGILKTINYNPWYTLL